MTQTIQAITQAQAAVLEEIGRHEHGGGTVSSIAQLREIHRCLEDMKRHVTKGSTEPAPNYGLGHLVMDSWPLDSQLGETILRTEQLYRKTTTANQ